MAEVTGKEAGPARPCCVKIFERQGEEGKGDRAGVGRVKCLDIGPRSGPTVSCWYNPLAMTPNYISEGLLSERPLEEARWAGKDGYPAHVEFSVELEASWLHSGSQSTRLLLAAFG